MYPGNEIYYSVAYYVEKFGLYQSVFQNTMEKNGERKFKIEYQCTKTYQIRPCYYNTEAKFSQFKISPAHKNNVL